MNRILVVDDSAADLALVGGLLRKAELGELIRARNGREALEQMELDVPDLVVTDLQMPEMNGLELVSALREKYPLVPVVLITSAGSEQIAVQALQAGAASYVPKCVLAQDLVPTLERVLDASRDERGRSRILSRVVHNEWRFVIENDPALIGSLVRYVRELVGQLRLFPANDSLRVSMALDEALLNAYYHGNLEVSSDLRESDHGEYEELGRRRRQEPPYRDRRITVEFRVDPEELSLTVSDEGPGFNPSELPDPTDPENLSRPSGRGVMLMRTFMDDVRFNAIGNQVTLTRRKRPTATPAAATD